MLKKFFPLRLNKYCQKLQKRFFFFFFVCRMIVSCLGGLVFHSFGYYLILLWMSISIGFFMVYLQLYSWSQIFFFPRIITSLGGKLLHNNVIFEWLSNLFVFSDLYACSAAMFLAVKYLTFHKMCGCCLVYLWQRQGEIPQRSWLMGKSEGGGILFSPTLLAYFNWWLDKLSSA